MTSGGISTRQHIVEAVVKMLVQRQSGDIHLADVAERAHVGVQTIYYHFDSRTQLIAEAQALAYFRMMEPFHENLTKAEKAIQEEDQELFWSAIGDNVMLAWSDVNSDDRWQVFKQLIDISQDATTQRDFLDSTEEQLDRWIEVFDSAQPLGWIDDEIDTRALVSSCSAASIGQALFVKSSKVHFTPQSMRDFIVNVAMAKPKKG
jgi:AcrR family transcriptional regulator